MILTFLSWYNKNKNFFSGSVQWEIYRKWGWNWTILWSVVSSISRHFFINCLIWLKGILMNLSDKVEGFYLILDDLFGKIYCDNFCKGITWYFIDFLNRYCIRLVQKFQIYKKKLLECSQYYIMKEDFFQLQPLIVILKEFKFWTK